MAGMGDALKNFGAGALGGYRDVLGMKMKEDAQARRDEALANRQANLEKLRYDMGAEDRKFEQKHKTDTLNQTINYQDKSLGLQEQQIKASQAQAAATAAATASARSSADADRDAQREMQRKVYSGEFDQEKSNKLAASLAAAPLAPGETQADRDAKISIVKSNIVTDAKSLNDLTKKDLTHAAKVIETSMENTHKQIKSIEETDPENAMVNKVKYINQTFNIKFNPEKDGSPDTFLYNANKQRDLGVAFGSSKERGKDEPPPAATGPTAGFDHAGVAQSLYDAKTPAERSKIQSNIDALNPADKAKVNALYDKGITSLTGYRRKAERSAGYVAPDDMQN